MPLRLKEVRFIEPATRRHRTKIAESLLPPAICGDNMVSLLTNACLKSVSCNFLFFFFAPKPFHVDQDIVWDICVSKVGWVSAKCSYHVHHVASRRRLRSENLQHFRRVCRELYVVLRCSLRSVRP